MEIFIKVKDNILSLNNTFGQGNVHFTVNNNADAISIFTN